jgi:hypothetical protein
LGPILGLDTGQKKNCRPFVLEILDDCKCLEIFLAPTITTPIWLSATFSIQIVDGLWHAGQEILMKLLKLYGDLLVAYDLFCMSRRHMDFQDEPMQIDTQFVMYVNLRKASCIFTMCKSNLSFSNSIK